MERLLKPTSTLRGVSARQLVSAAWILPPAYRKASISDCSWALTRARPATEWLSSLSLPQLPHCSRLLSSNSLMLFSPSTKTDFQVPCTPSRAAPRLDCRPPAAPSWRLYNPVSLVALFPDNQFFVIFCKDRKSVV